MHVKEIGLCRMALDLTHLGKTNLIISSAGETTKNTDPVDWQNNDNNGTI